MPHWLPLKVVQQGQKQNLIFVKYGINNYGCQLLLSVLSVSEKIVGFLFFCWRRPTDLSMYVYQSHWANDVHCLVDKQCTFTQHALAIENDVCAQNVHIVRCSKIRLIYFYHCIPISMTELHLSWGVVANAYLHSSKTAYSPRGNVISAVGADSAQKYSSVFFSVLCFFCFSLFTIALPV